MINSSSHKKILFSFWIGHLTFFNPSTRDLTTVPYKYWPSFPIKFLLIRKLHTFQRKTRILLLFHKINIIQQSSLFQYKVRNNFSKKNWSINVLCVQSWRKKKHVQMNFSTSASQHKETFVEEKKNDHGVFSSPNQRYTYRILQTIQMKPILLWVWAERAVLGRAKTALKFKYEI